MITQFLKDFKIIIFPRSKKNIFVLKVKGRKEYFIGDTPLLAYTIVRESLRGIEMLQVKLVEIPKNDKSAFPVFITEGERLKKVENCLMFYSPNTNTDIKSKRYLEPRVFALNSNFQLEKKQTETLELLKNTKTTKKLVIFSCECDYPFRVKICRIKSILQIFSECKRQVATKTAWIIRLML